MDPVFETTRTEYRSRNTEKKHTPQPIKNIVLKIMCIFITIHNKTQVRVFKEKKSGSPFPQIKLLLFFQ